VNPRRRPAAKPRAVAGYLAALPADQRAALERLRKLIHRVVPGAEDCISYGVPAVRLEGRAVVWYAAASRHCSFFPGSVVAEFAAELKDFSTSKGTVRFQPSHPLPATLVRRLVRARLARIAAKAPATDAGTRARARHSRSERA
jgi:uncharacterized protein YdhG (YjbR/CyaY superfamily)